MFFRRQQLSRSSFQIHLIISLLLPAHLFFVSCNCVFYLLQESALSARHKELIRVIAEKNKHSASMPAESERLLFKKKVLSFQRGMRFYSYSIWTFENAYVTHAKLQNCHAFRPGVSSKA